MTETKPIPITILTGFLGAGKTTLLNRILNADHGLRIAVMVNDFGAINIDAQLVVDVEGETISLTNGCICCTIRGDLVQATKDIINRPDPPEYIIVETSGVSDPLEVALTFRAIEQVTIDSILTIIDAEQILDVERAHAVLALNQVGMADIIILNKIDLIDSATKQRVYDYIHSIMADARVIEASHGEVPLELILGLGHFAPERLSQRAPADVHVHADDDSHDHDHAHTDHSLIFKTWTWQTSEPLSFKALRRAVQKLPPGIYRAKGLLQLANEPERRGVLQVVGRRAELTIGADWGAQIPYTQIVFIGADFDTDTLRQQLEGCLAANAPASDLARIADSALRWLRLKS